MINPCITTCTHNPRPTHTATPNRSHISSTSPWLTIGVLVQKEIAATANGQSFSRWLLSDLKGGELRVVLFGEAHSSHKSTVSCWCGLAVAVGSVIGTRRR